MENVAQSAMKKKSVRRDEPVVDDPPTDVDAVVVVASTVSMSKSNAKSKGDIGRYTEAPVFALSRLSQGTTTINVVSQGNFDGWKRSSEMTASVAAELANPFRNDATRNAARSRGSVFLSSGAEGADLVPLRTYIQE